MTQAEREEQKKREGEDEKDEQKRNETPFSLLRILMDSFLYVSISSRSSFSSRLYRLSLNLTLHKRVTEGVKEQNKK